MLHDPLPFPPPRKELPVIFADKERKSVFGELLHECAQRLCRIGRTGKMELPIADSQPFAVQFADILLVYLPDGLPRCAEALLLVGLQPIGIFEGVGRSNDQP